MLSYERIVEKNSKNIFLVKPQTTIVFHSYSGFSELLPGKIWEESFHLSTEVKASLAGTENMWQILSFIYVLSACRVL